jgi:hypothetical protein
MTLDDKIDKLLEMMTAIQTQLAARPAGTAKTGRWEQGGSTADDALLDGKYGQPKVFKTEPRDWEGPSYVGVAANEVPPEYGRMYADMMDVFGDMAKRDSKVDKNGKPLAWRKYQEAAIFRGWAKRNEAKPAAEADDNLPF